MSFTEDYSVKFGPKEAAMLNFQLSHSTQKQTCEGCGYDYDPSQFSTVEVELHDGTTRELPLCDKICSPDFWDETEPGEWVELRNAFTPTEQECQEVRKRYWYCGHCASVYKHDLVKIMLDTEYDPPSETIVCAFCQKKEKGRFQEAQQ